MSKGEEKIAKILADANLIFEQEKTYSDCGRGKYRFDFYVPRLRTLIEYDGEQHFHKDAFARTRSQWQHDTAHDRFKNSYALAHDIPLYRIPYWDIDNINTLTDIFNPIYRVKRRDHNDELRRSRNLE